ncbi:hypothetical protein DOY81_011649, partial [Sarcophaga bullata]
MELMRRCSRNNAGGNGEFNEVQLEELDNRHCLDLADEEQEEDEVIGLAGASDD